MVSFCVTSYEDIHNIIIPHFNKYPLQGSKSLEFEDFCEIAELMKNKAHITVKGLKRIIEIKNKMNTLRTHDL